MLLRKFTYNNLIYYINTSASKEQAPRGLNGQASGIINRSAFTYCPNLSSPIKTLYVILSMHIFIIKAILEK
jgi:hypothetical protein